jgi:hypothetical protein
VLDESGESPIAFLLSESMVGCVVYIETWIIWVPENQGKLNAAAPVLGDFVGFKAVLQIDRGLVDVITVGKE